MVGQLKKKQFFAHSMLYSSIYYSFHQPKQKGISDYLHSSLASNIIRNFVGYYRELSKFISFLDPKE